MGDDSSRLCTPWFSCDCREHAGSLDYQTETVDELPAARAFASDEVFEFPGINARTIDDEELEEEYGPGAIDEAEGLIIRFRTRKGVARKLTFTHSPLGMTFTNKMPLEVVKVARGGVADKLGVMVGWTFTDVAGQSLEFMDFEDTSALLKEEVGKLESLLSHDHTNWERLDNTDHSTWITFAENTAREQREERLRAERKAVMTKTAEDGVMTKTAEVMKAVMTKTAEGAKQVSTKQPDNVASQSSPTSPARRRKSPKAMTRPMSKEGSTKSTPSNSREGSARPMSKEGSARSSSREGSTRPMSKEASGKDQKGLSL